MSDITIHELEAAINFWRARSPSSGDELVLCKEASALSKPYALMIVQRRNALPPEGRSEGLRTRMPAKRFHRAANALLCTTSFAQFY